MKLTSPAFGEGEMIPKKYTCDGDNLSPPLAWSGVPQNAQALALIADDPDAPSGTWVHWVVFNLRPGSAGLPEGITASRAPEEAAVQGTNSFRKVGYGGPCPPPGTHRYFFKLYALDGPLALAANATAQDVQAAIQGHVLAEGQLMGRYKR
jgi:Raf kinase inhibitor-like YbhB/YbcL family protein